MTKFLAAVIVILSAFWSGVVGFWASDRTPPLTVLAIEVLNSPVKAGDDLKVRWIVDRYDQCASTVDRVIVDEQKVVYTLEDIDYRAGMGHVGSDIVITATTVPQQAGAGPAKYRVTVAYRCNPVHRVWPIVRSYEIPFDIRG